MPVSPTGASSGVEIVGLKEFQAALRVLDVRWDSAFSLAHQKIATKGAAYARTAARGGSKLEQKGASAIGPQWTKTQARVAVLPSKFLDPMANVAYWGAKRHTGWYAAGRYRDSTPQHPKWVGNTWEPLVPGQGPYVINTALAYRKEQLLDEYFEAIEAIAHRVNDAPFPEGG